jgi:hypothetical protein
MEAVPRPILLVLALGGTGATSAPGQFFLFPTACCVAIFPGAIRMPWLLAYQPAGVAETVSQQLPLTSPYRSPTAHAINDYLDGPRPQVAVSLPARSDAELARVEQGMAGCAQRDCVGVLVAAPVGPRYEAMAGQCRRTGILTDEACRGELLAAVLVAGSVSHVLHHACRQRDLEGQAPPSKPTLRLLLARPTVGERKSTSSCWMNRLALRGRTARTESTWVICVLCGVFSWISGASGRRMLGPEVQDLTCREARMVGQFVFDRFGKTITASLQDDGSGLAMMPWNSVCFRPSSAVRNGAVPARTPWYAAFAAAVKTELPDSAIP